MSQPMNREQRRMLKKQGQDVNEDGQVVSTKTSSKSTGNGSGGRVTDKGGTGSTKTESRNKRETAEVEERTSPAQFTLSLIHI